MNKLALSLLLALSPAYVSAATIAIIDSGTDYQHKDLVDQYALNDQETPGKSDRDGNGYKGDHAGWNFTTGEGDGQVIDYQYVERLAPLMPEIKKLFEVQVRSLEKTATPEDIEWMKAKRADEKFMKELQVFGNFAHGTHVAGITAGHSTKVEPENRPFAVKIIPTEVKLPFSKLFAESGTFRTMVRAGNAALPTSLREMLLSLALHYLAKQQSKIFTNIGHYVNVRGADVANGSFGTGYAQAKMIVTTLYNVVIKAENRNPAKIEELTREFLQQVLIGSRAMIETAPNTLFVFAAGNDGSDNDKFPVSPANLRGENTITVAATLRNRELASFSNYGKMVDVAAPGVGIYSLYPGDEHGLMSGTSQAAPYVAGVAATIKNQNTSLRPDEVKEILIGTVDSKSWLEGKVASAGVVNPARALEAAKLTNEMSVGDAIQYSRARVADAEVEAAPIPKSDGVVGSLIFLPLVSPIH